MTDSNGTKYVSVKFLVWVLVALFTFASGQMIYDTKKNIEKALDATECLAKDKVEKSDYFRDMGELKGSLGRIEDKIDRMRNGK